MISVSHLQKTFGTTVAVRDVSFSLAPGDVVGFLGRNGAGKTTTMRVLTGYFPPTSGEVRVAGYDVFEEPLAVKARVGYLPEQPPLYPEMIVRTYLRFCAKLKGLRGKRAEERVESVVARCGVDSVQGRIIGNLSRGYRQRVALAQALVHDPDVLVLDEPTTSLDPGQIHEIRSLLRELSAEERPAAGRPSRRTVILSTHRLEDVQATCARVVIISRGTVVLDATLEEATRGASLEERFLALTSDEEAARKDGAS